MPKGTATGKTPGGELKKLIEDHKLSVRATAIEMGEQPVSLTAVVNGKRKVTAELALKLEKVFGKKAMEWLQMQLDRDLAEAKGKASLQNKIAKMKKADQIESGRAPRGSGKTGAKKGPKAATGAKRGPKPGPKGTKPAATGAKRGPKPKTTVTPII